MSETQAISNHNFETVFDSMLIQCSFKAKILNLYTVSLKAY